MDLIKEHAPQHGLSVQEAVVAQKAVVKGLQKSFENYSYYYGAQLASALENVTYTYADGSPEFLFERPDWMIRR